VTDESIISTYGLADPNPFFQALMGKPYLGSVAVAPHVYRYTPRICLMLMLC
jgi:hypothetical protein